MPRAVASRAAALAALLGAAAGSDLALGTVTGTERLERDLRSTVECNDDYESLPLSCRPSECRRVVVDGMLTDDDADSLRRLTDSAIAFVSRQAGLELTDDWGEEPHPPKLFDGPTIVDVNTGYVRHSKLGLRMLYRPHPKRPKDPVFQPDRSATALYRRVAEALAGRLREEFGLSSLHFTAPTFVARLQGAEDWEPRDAHDEYWHPHVDRNNTAHYHYSALLYLATGDGEDFEGGEFQFMDGGGNATVLPRKGRAVLFSAGQENLHRVRPVSAGVRYAISMWFTCDEDFKMPLFLDGTAHTKFAGRKRRIKRHSEL